MEDRGALETKSVADWSALDPRVRPAVTPFAFIEDRLSKSTTQALKILGLPGTPS